MKSSMKSQSLPIQCAVAAILTALAVGGVYFVSSAGADAPPATAGAPTAMVPGVVAAVTSTAVPNVVPGVVHYAADAPQLASIVVRPVRFETVPVLEPQPGRVAYDETRTTRISSPIAGRVLSARVEIGDPVRAGQILAQLDAPDLANADADWQKARADELRKQRAFERTRALLDAEVVARKDFEGAEADLAQARSETRRTVLRMRNLSATASQNGRYDIKTALAGTVTERQINPGQEVRPDLAAPLFVVSDLERLWVIVDVPEQAAALLHVGQRATVESEAWPGLSLEATVDRVGMLLDPGTRRVQVRCRVQNQGGKLKPEMFARVSFLPGSADRSADRRADSSTDVQAVALPNTSLFIEGRYSHVFVQTHPGTFEKRRVNVRSSNRERSYIDAGLAAGESVVTEGAFLLTTEASGNAR